MIRQRRRFPFRPTVNGTRSKWSAPTACGKPTWRTTWRLDNETVHAEAERLEHAHDLADQLDELLGQPTVDPHGSKIPSRPE